MRWRGREEEREGGRGRERERERERESERERHSDSPFGGRRGWRSCRRVTMAPRALMAGGCSPRYPRHLCHWSHWSQCRPRCTAACSPPRPVVQVVIAPRTARGCTPKCASRWMLEPLRSFTRQPNPPLTPSPSLGAIPPSVARSQPLAGPRRWIWLQWWEVTWAGVGAAMAPTLRLTAPRGSRPGGHLHHMC